MRDLEPRDEFGPESLAFPVIAVGRQMGLQLFGNASALQTANSLALRRGLYKDLTLIDNSGESYSVADATVVGYGTPFWGFQFMKPRLLRLALRLNRRPPLLLSDVQKTVIKNIRNMPKTWDSAWNQSSGELRRQVLATQTVAELITVLVRHGGVISKV